MYHQLNKEERRKLMFGEEKKQFIGEPFMELSTGHIFGDYQVFFDLSSNIHFQVAPDEEHEFVDPLSTKMTTFMCCDKAVVQDLCELYPRTAENLKLRSLEKRAVFLHCMGEPSSLVTKTITSPDQPLSDVLKLIPREQMMQPSFLESEGVEQMSAEVKNEIAKSTEKCVELMTQVN
jgi:hypothetical protein